MVDLVSCGAINWDINIFVDRLPRVGEEVKVQEIQRVSGGTAANVSVAAARILGPGRVALIGALGCDDVAEKQIEALKREAVVVSGISKIPNEESGQAYIIISSNGENEIHTYFGANLRLSPESLQKPAKLELMKSAKIAVIMDPPLATAKNFARICVKNGATVIWDPGVYSELGWKALEPTLKYVDYLVLNHLEFEILIGVSDPVKILDFFTERNKGIKVIIKHGEKGCYMCDSVLGKSFHIGAVPLNQMGLEVVNTVGCGDAFIGSFAAAKIEGIDDIQALKRGCAAGSFKATKKETRGGPTANQLQEIMEKWEAL